MVLPQETLVEYPSSQALSLIAIVFFAILSTLAVGFVLLHVSWVSVRSVLVKHGHESFPRVRFFFQTQLGAYTASLLLSNFLGSIAFMLNSHWAEQKVIVRGSLCTAQAVLGEISDVANAYFTGAISIHAFNTLVCHNRMPIWVCVAAVGLGWVLAIVVGLFPLAVSSQALGPVYGYDGLSCGISLEYPALQVVLSLVPVFLSAIVSMVFFVLIFLILRGTLVIKGRLKINVDPEVRWSIINTSGSSREYHCFVIAVVKTMLWYPIAFVGLLLWPSIINLMEVVGCPVAFGFHVFAETCAAMLGLANAVILLNTIRILSPFLMARDESHLNGDHESFVVVNASPVDSPTKTPAEGLYSPQTFEDAHKTPQSTESGVQSSAESGGAPLTLQRTITPVAELEALIAVPEPAYKTDSHNLSIAPNNHTVACGLPAPRRSRRSPVMRQPSMYQPSMQPVAFPTSSSLVAAAGLQTPTGCNFSEGSPRSSVSSTYASRLPVRQDLEGSRISRPKNLKTNTRRAATSLNFEPLRSRISASQIDSFSTSLSAPERAVPPHMKSARFSQFPVRPRGHTVYQGITPHARHEVWQRTSTSSSQVVNTLSRPSSSSSDASTSLRPRSHVHNSESPKAIRSHRSDSYGPTLPFSPRISAVRSQRVVVHEGASRSPEINNEHLIIVSRTPSAKSYGYI
ncbi:hypothetical protein AcW1_008470 [Taiwanofungus camphoratus]|nr:hypothetical protein AcW1_008470 [Antrodia cinnamomea]